MKRSFSETIGQSGARTLQKPTAKKTILIVDDEPEIIDFLSTEFEGEFSVLAAADGEQCLRAALAKKPDLILLDITMPVMDGLEACRRLKSNPQTEPIPILVLSARTEIQVLLTAFEIGVDDYVEKPFRVEELKARIAAKLRKRQPRPNPSIVEVGNLRLDLDGYQAFVSGEPVKFSRSEFLLVKFLVENSCRVVSRAEILKKVWAKETVSERTVDIYLVTIRKKLGKFDHEIAMLYGAGYIVRPRSS